jgi:hypothetical protein
MRVLLTGLVALAALAVALPASAKDFEPGDLRVCNMRSCVPIVAPEVVALLGPFYYSGTPPARVSAPRLGAPYYELRFENGYATGIVATRRLDRFLSYGVHLGRFAPGRWYRTPSALATELRRLTLALQPLRLTRAALDRSR